MDMPSSPGSMISSITSRGIGTLPDFASSSACHSSPASEKPRPSKPDAFKVYSISSLMLSSSSTQ